MDGAGKKTADAIHQEMAREVDALLERVFAEQRKSGRLDLEAIEMAMRAVMHRAGAGGLEQLLEMSPPVERAVGLRLWTASTFSRDAAQTHRHGAGPYPDPARLLPVLSLSAGPEPGRFAMGYRRHGVLSGRAENDGSGGQRGIL